MKEVSKKGELSRLSINLLIGSLILILAVIIWIILRQGSGNVEQQVYDDSQLDLKISQVKKIDDNTLDITLKRNVGEGEFVGLSFVVNDGKTTEIIKLNTSLLENETGNFSLDFIYINASKIKSISVTPIYINEEGSPVAGEVKDEYITPNVCSNYCPDGAQCGFNGCGMQCGSGCDSGYLCLNYKCIKQTTSSGSSGGGGSSSSSTTTPTCTDTCESLGYECGTQTVCSQSIDCGTCTAGYECVSGNCSECISHDYSECYQGDVYWYDSCDNREEARYDCLNNQTCLSGTCVDCTTHTSSNCSDGDVYWWNSCGQREDIRYDCFANQTCSGSACVDCTTHASSNCSDGDVYWWNSCGQREDIRYDCNSTQTCSAGTCVNNPVLPPQTGAIIADHTVVADFDIIPTCWIDEAKEQIVMGYGHTSHGSQITTGLAMVKAEHGSLYDYNNGGINGALDYEEGAGYSSGWLGYDVGYGGWDDETRYYLDGYDPGAGTADHSDVNTIMWSWCGQVNDVDLETHYFDNMEDLESEYPYVTFVYMTGHRESSQADLIANNQIRDYVDSNEKVLFDFADIESYDPDGTFYPNDNDVCAWCSTWCLSHDCPDAGCGDCAHSHCFNCYNKGKAFWWMLARMAGWDGTAGDACP